MFRSFRLWVCVKGFKALKLYRVEDAMTLVRSPVILCGLLKTTLIVTLPVAHTLDAGDSSSQSSLSQLSSSRAAPLKRLAQPSALSAI